MTPLRWAILVFVCGLAFSFSVWGIVVALGIGMGMRLIDILEAYLIIRAKELESKNNTQSGNQNHE